MNTQQSDWPFRLGKPKWGEDMLVYNANEGLQPALYWLESLVQTGPSAEFLKNLNARLRAVPETIQAYPEMDPTTLKVSSSYVAKGDAGINQQWSEAELDWLWAYLLATAIEKGSLRHLKRCNLRDCSKYFIGDPRSKWCSKTCGSLYRVTKQRNPDNPAKWKSMVWEY